MASVTAPLGGFIVETGIVPGTRVKQGSLLAKLSNPEYITLQQSYLETASQLRFAEQDYQRQKTLEEQNATALKKLQESETSFTVLKARLAGIREQLRMIGINFRDLENGVIQSVVNLRAPLGGYVTKVNHHPGQFVEARDVIFEIVDLSDLHLHLNVFEQDIAGVHKGQSVRFRPSAGTPAVYRGEISLISPQRDEDARTFDVHGHIEEADDRLKPGMYVEAEILVSDDSVYALPEGALVFNGNETFVVTEEDGDYAMRPVEPGAKLDGWVEITNAETLRGKMIVTEGASRVFAALSRRRE
jgi:cobalt-zinc-cadmium efflux system membrane fusion protein